MAYPYPQQQGYPAPGAPGVAYTGAPVTAAPVMVAQPYPQQGYPQQAYPAAAGAGYPQQTYVASPPGVVVVQQTVAARPYGKMPCPMSCPFCRAAITTNVVTQPGCFAWAMAGILCFVGCWPCCLIPFCVPSCMDAVHSCPNCGAGLGLDPGTC